MKYLNYLEFLSIVIFWKIILWTMYFTSSAKGYRDWEPRGSLENVPFKINEGNKGIESKLEVRLIIQYIPIGLSIYQTFNLFIHII